jgi:hypothetical protein
VEQLTVIDEVASVFEVVPVVILLKFMLLALIEHVDDTWTITSKLLLLLSAAAENEIANAPISAVSCRVKNNFFIIAS